MCDRWISVPLLTSARRESRIDQVQHLMTIDQNPYEAPRAATTENFGNRAGGHSREFGIGEVLGLGLTAVRRQPVELVGGYFLTFFVSWLVQMLPQLLLVAGLVPSGSVAGAALVAVSGSILGMFASSFFIVGQLRVALAAARGEVVELSQFFSGGDRFGIALLVQIIQAVCIVVGTIFFIVPGLILALGWSLSTLFVADSDCGVGEALRESWAMTRGQRGKIFLFGFAAVGVLFLGLLALVVGMFVALPIVVVAFATIYVRITGNVEAPS